jgi:hypothetical protein
MIATVTYTGGRRTKGPIHDSHGYLYRREETKGPTHDSHGYLYVKKENQRAYI